MGAGEGRKGHKVEFSCNLWSCPHPCMRPEITISAFCKTGVWPFDRTVVTAGMMAPSLESAQQVTLPVVPPMPVCIVSELIRTAAALPREVVGEEGSSIASAARGSASRPISAVQTPVRNAAASLNRTAAGFLVSNAPMTPRASVPAIHLAPIMPGPRGKT
jgi:hypothetical protein